MRRRGKLVIMTEPDHLELGYTFAAALLADPATNVAALDEPSSSGDHRLAVSELLFKCGRQTGLIELGDEAAAEFLKGFVHALADRLEPLDAPPRRRGDDPN